jgi:hypothetical protein
LNTSGCNYLVLDGSDVTWNRLGFPTMGTNNLSKNLKTLFFTPWDCLKITILFQVQQLMLRVGFPLKPFGKNTTNASHSTLVSEYL